MTNNIRIIFILLSRTWAQPPSLISWGRATYTTRIIPRSNRPDSVNLPSRTKCNKCAPSISPEVAHHWTFPGGTRHAQCAKPFIGFYRGWDGKSGGQDDCKLSLHSDRHGRSCGELTRETPQNHFWGHHFPFKAQEQSPSYNDIQWVGHLLYSTIGTAKHTSLCWSRVVNKPGITTCGDHDWN